MKSLIADDLCAIVTLAASELRKLRTDIVSERPAPDRWTIKEVLGHLIDSAANNHQRFVRAQLTDELKFPKYEQNEWVSAQRYDDADWQDLVSLWVHYNQHLAHIIRNVKDEALSVRCTIGDYAPVTLQFVIEDYVAHLRHHLGKLAPVYVTLVSPWDSLSHPNLICTLVPPDWSGAVNAVTDPST
jgi:hypothetical protein